MQSFFITFFALFFLTGAEAQVLYQQNFEDGFQDIVLIDNDGNTPVAQLSSFSEAWNVRGDLLGNAAVSISWYDPEGQSDDWMITPTISGITSKTVLEWDARAFEASTPDAYKVLVSVSGTDIADFTDEIFQINGEEATGVFKHRYVLLDQYAGKDIHIAFVNISNNQYMLAVDNILVRNVRDVDVAFLNVTADPYVRTGVANKVNYTIKNEGFQMVDTVIIQWTDGANQFAETLTGLGLGFGEIHKGTFSSFFTATNPDEYLLNCSVTSLGSAQDEFISNNQAVTTVVGVTTVVPRRVVAEEGTGTWCGWCPRGAVYMDLMHQTYPDLFIPVAVHNGPGEPMKNVEYDQALSGFPDFPGFPSVLMDRSVLVNPIDMDSVMQELLQVVAPVDITVQTAIDSVNRTIYIDGDITTYSNRTNAQHNLVLVVAENDVRGTSNGYRQTNYYSGGGQGVMGGFENLPNPVPASQMRYDFVGRELLHGFLGQSGVVPATYHENDVFEYTATYIVPAGYDLDQLYVVAMLLDSGSGVVLNAAQSGKATSSVAADPKAPDVLTIYPNPTQGTMLVDMELPESAGVVITLINQLGQAVYVQEGLQLPAGHTVLPVSITGVPAGIYLVKMNIAGKFLFRKLVVG